MTDLSIIILESQEGLSQKNWMEELGNYLLFTEFYGRKYHLIQTPISPILKAREQFTSFTRMLLKVIIIALTPLIVISTLFGLGIKYTAHKLEPDLALKYQYKVLVNAREPANFSGKLPPNPWTPNCVNSQQKSLWGNLYNAEPIIIPTDITNPLAKLKSLLKTAQIPHFDCSKMQLIEEQENYLHYTYTVEISKGLLKGTYIDDVDIYYNSREHHFDIRSASRKGFRDAIHLDFSQPGANKNRIEAIRQLWTAST